MVQRGRNWHWRMWAWSVQTRSFSSFAAFHMRGKCVPVCKMDGPVPLRECTLTAFGAELFSGGLLKIEQGVARNNNSCSTQVTWLQSHLCGSQGANTIQPLSPLIPPQFQQENTTGIPTLRMKKYRLPGIASVSLSSRSFDLGPMEVSRSPLPQISCHFEMDIDCTLWPAFKMYQ